ncbi:CLUMA_CG004232, isoform A [Clunio marinus]|uniref:CLUMA_CG004232, isoform A n=1 Tax=Clunio marinus TaxID=568069 RepID=A0A1J1HR32_9DIPT|nr:CLUMA_CG004232, isoform A [Clunio marinus]
MFNIRSFVLFCAMFQCFNGLDDVDHQQTKQREKSSGLISSLKWEYESEQTRNLPLCNEEIHDC